MLRMYRGAVVQEEQQPQQVITEESVLSGLKWKVQKLTTEAHAAWGKASIHEKDKAREVYEALQKISLSL